MRLGYFMQPLHPPGADVTQTLQDDMAQIVALDRLGFDEAWIGEHLTLEWENITSPEIFIGMALAKTERIKLGTGVSCLPNHHPFFLAHRIAMLDHLAQGRFQWGVGPGSTPGDMDAFQVDWGAGEHYKLARATVEAVLDLWSGAEPGYYGNRWFRYRVPEPMAEVASHVYLKPYQQPHPPIAVAGLSPESPSLTWAGERGWSPMSIQYSCPRVLRGHWASVEAGARAAGRVAARSEWRVCREVLVAETSAEARRLALEGVLRRDYEDYNLVIMKQFDASGLFKDDPELPDSAVTPEFLADNMWIVGSVEEVTEKLRALYETVGGFGVLLVLAHEWTPREAWEQSMRLLAEEVLPRLSDLS